MSKITPFLWFDDNLDEAIQFYSSVFKNNRLLFEVKYGDAGPGPKGTTMTAIFELDGQKLMALNGGPMVKFTEAISLFITCDNQQEIDYYWERLSEGGQKSRCGWLKDKFGLSWQVVPYNMIGLLHNDDPQKANNVMRTMMKMDKLDMSVLEEAGK